MLRGPGPSIRVRLFLLFTLPIALLLLKDAVELGNRYSASLAAAQDRAIALARDGADRQAELISEVRTLLNVFSHVDEIVGGTADRCRAFLAGATREKPWLKGLWVANGDGEVVCSTVPGSAGLNLASKSYFTKAVRDRNFLVEHYVLGATRGVPAIIAALPVISADGTRVERVLLASLDLSWLTRISDEVSKTVGAVVLLTSEEGTVLARNPDLNNLVGLNFASHPLLTALRASTQGNLDLDDLDGKTKIFGFARLPSTKASLAVGLPRDEILADVNNDLWRSLYQLMIIGATGLVVAWFGGEALVIKPIRELAGVASRFGAGDFSDRRQPVARRGEFGLLESALQDMAAQIERRELGLRNTATQMASLAEIDALTGLSNRRSFDNSLGAAFRKNTPEGPPSTIAVLLIDVDHFKRLNDRLGHLAGDRALKRVAAALRTTVPQRSSIVARFGGEEFAIILREFSEIEARTIAEQICAGLANLRIANPDAPAGILTASIGVAVEPWSDQLRPEALVEKADIALYHAKRLGRNCVVSARLLGRKANGGRSALAECIADFGSDALLNGAELDERLRRALEDGRREAAQLALVYVGVQPPQPHESVAAEFEFLVQCAERLLELVGSMGVVGCLDDGRLAVLQLPVRTQGDVRTLCENILERLAGPLPHARGANRVSIGACWALAGSQASEVVEHAGVAFEVASGMEAGGIRIFTPEADRPFEGRLQIERDLRQAIDAQSGLRLAYQPIYAADGLTLKGVEALARWDHPEKGPVAPGIFIPIAEEYGLIDQLGEWVLKEACMAAARWPTLRMALNVSPAQLKRIGFVDLILDTVRETRVDPSRLELEITESMFLTDTETTRKSLERLRQTGIRIALDDFGTGYSSLSCLTRFPIDRIKIDRSFVQTLGAIPESLTVVAAMVGLAHTMGIEVTAEGVETVQQHRLLSELGCTDLQGFLFSEPVFASAIDAMLGMPAGGRKRIRAA
jgi:diguanylate cyclase (GGDEF)-like protein